MPRALSSIALMRRGGRADEGKVEDTVRFDRAVDQALALIPRHLAIDVVDQEVGVGIDIGNAAAQLIRRLAGIFGDDREQVAAAHRLLRRYLGLRRAVVGEKSLVKGARTAAIAGEKMLERGAALGNGARRCEDGAELPR